MNLPVPVPLPGLYSSLHSLTAFRPVPVTHRARTVLGLVLGVFMGALEATVVSTAMPTVVGDLGGIQVYSWVFTAYMVASTVTVPVFGKLADLYGRKPIVLGGSALFLVGSAASGAAGSMTQLIVFRAVQGLGAGAMQPMALTIVGDLYELEERARVQAFFGAVWGTAGFVGPLVGGLIVRYVSWRWVFYLNLPFGLASLALVAASFHERVERKEHVIDWAGAVLLSALVMALLASAHGGIFGWVCLGLAPPLAWALLTIERRAKEPILPLPLFRRRVIWVSSVASAASGGAMFCSITYVPLLVQGVMHGTPTEAGGAIAPMLIGWPIASFICGRLLPRIGFRPPLWAGLTLCAGAMAALAIVVEVGPSLWPLRIAAAFFGFGMGFAVTSLVIAVQTSVEWQERGVATASTLFFRTVGGTLAVGALGGVLTRILLRDTSIPAHAADDLLGPRHGAGLDPAVIERLAESLYGGLRFVFWATFAFAALALLFGALFPHVPTRRAQSTEPAAP